MSGEPPREVYVPELEIASTIQVGFGAAVGDPTDDHASDGSRS